MNANNDPDYDPDLLQALALSRQEEEELKRKQEEEENNILLAMSQSLSTFFSPPRPRLLKPLPIPTTNTFFRVNSEEELPQEVLCPITQELYKDPVICIVDGHTYERKELERWLHNHDETPLARAKVTDKDFKKILIPNLALKGLIDKILETNPHLYPQQDKNNNSSINRLK